MSCSNFEFKLITDEEDDLISALKILFRNGPNGKATHWKITSDGWLYLMWVDGEGSIPFPAELSSDESLVFLKSWLNKQKPSGSPPNHDGSNDPNGYEIEAVHSYAFMRIRKVWAQYYK